MQNGALRLPSPDPRANALEVFKRNPTLRALSLPNDAFADRVVHVLGKAILLSGQLAQPPLCRQGTLLLKPISEPPLAVAHAFHRTPAVDHAVRVGGDIRHAQVDPDHIVDILGVGFLDLAHREQIPCTTHQRQVDLTALRLEQGPLACATDEGDGLSPI